MAFEEIDKAGHYAQSAEFAAKWEQIMAVRDDVKKALEQARADKTIGASLEAKGVLHCSDAVYDLLNAIAMAGT